MNAGPCASPPCRFVAGGGQVLQVEQVFGARRSPLEFAEPRQRGEADAVEFDGRRPRRMARRAWRARRRGETQGSSPFSPPDRPRGEVAAVKMGEPVGMAFQDSPRLLEQSPHGREPFRGAHAQGQRPPDAVAGGEAGGGIDGWCAHGQSLPSGRGQGRCSRPVGPHGHGSTVGRMRFLTSGGFPCPPIAIRRTAKSSSLVTMHDRPGFLDDGAAAGGGDV